MARQYNRMNQRVPLIYVKLYTYQVWPDLAVIFPNDVMLFRIIPSIFFYQRAFNFNFCSRHTYYQNYLHAFMWSSLYRIFFY
jgi:hypothetical protein